MVRTNFFWPQVYRLLPRSKAATLALSATSTPKPYSRPEYRQCLKAIIVEVREIKEVPGILALQIQCRWKWLTRSKWPTMSISMMKISIRWSELRMTYRWCLVGIILNHRCAAFSGVSVLLAIVNTSRVNISLVSQGCRLKDTSRVGVSLVSQGYRLKVWPSLVPQGCYLLQTIEG